MNDESNIEKGRRFTRRNTQSIFASSRWCSDKKAWLVESANSKNTIDNFASHNTEGYNTPEGVLECWCEIAASYLKTQGLPCTALVDYEETTDDNRVNQYEGASIKAYILDYCGYEPDSIEGLAARILTIADQYKHKRLNLFMLGLELGEITTLIHVESVLRFEKPRTPEKHFTAYADELVKANPKLKPGEYWEIVRQNENNFFIDVDKESKKEIIVLEILNEKSIKRSKRQFIYKYIKDAQKRYELKMLDEVER